MKSIKELLLTGKKKFYPYPETTDDQYLHWLSRVLSLDREIANVMIYYLERE